MDSDQPEDPESSRRRRAGRLAQRAFRQRQIDTIERLENENIALKAAMQDIRKVSTHLNSPELDRAVNRALEIAGKEPAKPESAQRSDASIDPIMDLRLRTESFAHVYSTSGGSPVAAQTTRPLLNQPAPTIGPAIAELPSFFPMGTVAVQTEDTPQHLSPGETYQTGRMSPRLTYGLWFEPDRFIQLDRAPPDILPYLGEGEQSFAGALFWGTLETWYLLLGQYQKRELLSSSQSPLSPTALVHTIFGIWFKFVPPETLIQCMKIKLQWRKYRRVDAYDHDSIVRLRGIMQQELTRRGDNTSRCLTALEVAEYIRDQCVHGTLEQLNVASNQQDGEVAKQPVIGLIKKIALHCFVCNDGPRFRVEAVNEVVRKFSPGFSPKFVLDGI